MIFQASIQGPQGLDLLMHWILERVKKTKKTKKRKACKSLDDTENKISIEEKDKILTITTYCCS